MDKISLEVLGRRLQQLRQTRGLSISQLATDAGMAKSNLSRLEQGDGNPTLDTIWRLAMQLKVPFGSLVDPLSTPFGDKGIYIRLIEQSPGTPKVDAYWTSYAPHTERISEAHTPGTRETVTLISGQLETGQQGDTVMLSPGDSHTFFADKPHVYRSNEFWTSMLITIVYTADETKA